MSITAIFTGVVAIAKAIPVVKKWFNELVDMWLDMKIKEVESTHISKQVKRDVLMKKIQGAKNDLELQTLSIILDDINKL